VGKVSRVAKVDKPAEAQPARPARPAWLARSASNSKARPAWDSFTRSEKEASLRERATLSEIELNRMLGLHPVTQGQFKFQAAWRGYYLDFLFAKQKLVVELDGACHKTAKAKMTDARRTAKLNKAGYRVIRFWNGELRQPEKVMTRIVNSVLGEQPPLTPQPDTPPLTLDCLAGLTVSTRGRARRATR
jgi:very-short-patch-repair endonuclease